MLSSSYLILITILAVLSLLLLGALLFLNLRKQKADQLAQAKADARWQEIITLFSTNHAALESTLNKLLTQNENSHRNLIDVISGNFNAAQVGNQDLKETFNRNFTQADEQMNRLFSKLESALNEASSKTAQIIEGNSKEASNLMERHSQMTVAKIHALKEEISKLSSTLEEATSL